MIRKVSVGDVVLGGGKIAVQSMTTKKTSDVEASVAQILSLQNAGCDIVRVAIADEADARALREITARVRVPIVADVHFSAKLAVLAVENGADKLRINPGNIGKEAEIGRVADCVKAHGIPVRVGSNTGSIEKEHLARYGRSARALVESALQNVAVLERHGVRDIVISVKASDVPLTVEAYTLLRGQCDYPLHLGVTEAGTHDMGIVKSSVGIGALLLSGIGETIRVSLSDDPVEEVYAGHAILRACGLESDYVEVVACPPAAGAAMIASDWRRGCRNACARFGKSGKLPSWAVWSTARARRADAISALRAERNIASSCKKAVRTNAFPRRMPSASFSRGWKS